MMRAVDTTRACGEVLNVWMAAILACWALSLTPSESFQQKSSEFKVIPYEALRKIMKTVIQRTARARGGAQGPKGPGPQGTS